MCTYAYTLRLKAREQLLDDLIAANPLIHTLKSSPGELADSGRGCEIPCSSFKGGKVEGELLKYLNQFLSTCGPQTSSISTSRGAC